jgi:C_GCAxxG_C_C family probable redox protein
MANQIEKTIESFRGGLNCAQTVVSSYADELKFDKEMAVSISCGFGGGMGRLQGTCGAVTGSYMVLGMYNCKKHADNKERKAATYEMVQRFNEKFLEANGSTDCISLLNCEIKSDEGQLKAKESGLFVTVCEKCIIDSIAIVDNLIGKQS